jgi:hypothetical protein
MQYQILSVNSVRPPGTDFKVADEQLADLVNKEIERGWRPLGGVAIGETQSTNAPFLFQAMTKD